MTIKTGLFCGLTLYLMAGGVGLSCEIQIQNNTDNRITVEVYADETKQQKLTEDVYISSNNYEDTIMGFESCDRALFLVVWIRDYDLLGTAEFCWKLSEPVINILDIAVHAINNGDFSSSEYCFY